MINLRNYVKHNTLQTKVNIECLQEYDLDAGWRINCNSAVDIGSGDGSFTSNVLTKCLPEKCKSIVGYDKNEEMVQHANNNYKNERVSFEVRDISGKLPKENYDKFDQAFSFFTIHWCTDQR